MLVLLLLLACHVRPSTPDTGPEDADQDGVAASADCDDADPTVGMATTWHPDADGDGFGDASRGTLSCEPEAGLVADDTDCDDRSARIHPDATEDCDDVDNDCDGEADEDLDGCSAEVIFFDDFDDLTWDGWTTENLAGYGEVWATSGALTTTGVLYEISDGGNSVALTSDLGLLDAWSLSVDVNDYGRNCNGLGIVMGWTSTREYTMVRWQDPAGDYGSYPRGGGLDLYRCVGGRCTSLEADDGGVDIVAEYGVFYNLSVLVSGADVTVSWTGTDLFTTTLTGAVPFGPARVGLWSDDCDGGAVFDNVEVVSY